jgi:hypothetical protein
MTSGGRLGGCPLHDVGNRSMKYFSAAGVALTFTCCDSATRMPLPSGSRRAVPT